MMPSYKIDSRDKDQPLQFSNWGPGLGTFTEKREFVVRYGITEDYLYSGDCEYSWVDDFEDATRFPTVTAAAVAAARFAIQEFAAEPFSILEVKQRKVTEEYTEEV
jgi:hypothetical protein